MTITPRRLARALGNRADVLGLRTRNRVSRARITGEANCVVSITTYGSRTFTVSQTIESIARGTIRPKEIYLWLDDSTPPSALPQDLLRLKQRGLTILPCYDYRSHKKYYPYVKDFAPFKLPLVTADDDVIYPRNWLAQLMAAHAATPELVVAQRARIMQLDGTSNLAPYSTWPECESTLASPNVFPTGVSGVLYPVQVQEALRDAGEAFLDVVPHSDDAWLHFQTRQAGTMARQASTHPQDYFGVAGSQKGALWRTNVDAGGNDAQLAALYQGIDLGFLQD